MSRELRANVEEYLRIRRALGFKLEDHGRLLWAFIDHLERIGASTPTVEAALQWATAPQGVQPFRWKQRLSVVRGFARYLHGLDPAVPVPPSDLLVYRRRRPTPYVMSDTDITQLLSAASQRPRPLTAATYHTLFGLIAVTAGGHEYSPRTDVGFPRVDQLGSGATPLPVVAWASRNDWPSVSTNGTQSCS